MAGALQRWAARSEDAPGLLIRLQDVWEQLQGWLLAVKLGNAVITWIQWRPIHSRLGLEGPATLLRC